MSILRRLNCALRLRKAMLYGPERFEPGVFGIFRPVLLLPRGISHHLTAPQLEVVLAHELCHVRRRDNLASAIHMIVEALWPDLSSLSSGPPPLPPQLPPEQKYCSWGGGVHGPDATQVVIDAQGGTIDHFSKSLLNLFVGKWIIDSTGLTGKFDIHLEFAMSDEFRQRYAERTGRPLSEIPTGPTISEALQEQLGLRLETTKGPVEILVIDRIERPTPN